MNRTLSPAPSLLVKENGLMGPAMIAYRYAAFSKLTVKGNKP